MEHLEVVTNLYYISTYAQRAHIPTKRLRTESNEPGKGIFNNFEHKIIMTHFTHLRLTSFAYVIEIHKFDYLLLFTIRFFGRQLHSIL